MQTPSISTEQLSVELLDEDDLSLQVTNATITPSHDEDLRGVPERVAAPVFVGADEPGTPDSAAVSEEEYALDAFLAEYGLDGYATATHEDAATTLVDTEQGELHTDPVLWSLAQEEVDAPIPGQGAPEPERIEGRYSRQEEVFYRTKRKYGGPEIDVDGEHAAYLVPLIGTAVDAGSFDSYDALADGVTVTVPEVQENGY